MRDRKALIQPRARWFLQGRLSLSHAAVVPCCVRQHPHLMPALWDTVCAEGKMGAMRWVQGWKNAASNFLFQTEGRNTSKAE